MRHVLHHRGRHTKERSTGHLRRHGANVPAICTKKRHDARALRHEMEAFDGHEDAKAVDFAWPQLASTDRVLRYAARIAIESQPIEQWKSRALSKPIHAALTALLAVRASAARNRG